MHVHLHTLQYNFIYLLLLWISFVSFHLQCQPIFFCFGFFFLPNNEISAWGELGVMLPEQPMRPIYLSSTWGIEPTYLVSEKDKNASSVFHILPS